MQIQSGFSLHAAQHTRRGRSGGGEQKAWMDDRYGGGTVRGVGEGGRGIGWDWDRGVRWRTRKRGRGSQGRASELSVW